MNRTLHRLLLAALVAALGCSPKLQTDVSRMPVDDEGRQPLRIGQVVKKRQIAPVMSVAHADWLTRPDRDAEEQPDRVVRELSIKRGSTVADLGAGVGYFTWRLARAVGETGKVIAVDIQPGMLERLKQNLAERNINNVDAVLGDEDNPRLPEGAVDQSSYFAGRCLTWIAAVLLAVAWLPGPLLGATEAAKQRVARCVRFWGEPRMRAYGYDHVVHLHSECAKMVRCRVSTDVDPQPIVVDLEPDESREVITRTGSPARDFTPSVACRFLPPNE